MCCVVFVVVCLGLFCCVMLCSRCVVVLCFVVCCWLCVVCGCFCCDLIRFDGTFDFDCDACDLLCCVV